MSLCERRIYPEGVVKSVREQLKELPNRRNNDKNYPENLPPQPMRLTEKMKGASLRSELVRTLPPRPFPVNHGWDGAK